MLRVIYLTIFWLHLSEFLLSSQLNRLCDFSLVPSSVDRWYFCCYFCFEFITIKPPITSYGFFSGPALGMFELYGGIGPPISAAAVLVRKKLCKKGKGSPCSITERRVPDLIPVLGSQPAGDVNHKPGGRLPLHSARPAVTPATLKRAATSFAAWWTEARWAWTVYLRLLPDSVAVAIWTRALLRLSPAR